MKIQQVTEAVILNLFQDLKRCLVRRSRNKFGMTAWMIGGMTGRQYFRMNRHEPWLTKEDENVISAQAGIQTDGLILDSCWSLPRT